MAARPALRTHHEVLQDFAAGVGGGRMDVQGEFCWFDLGPFPTCIYMKRGGSRLRGSLFLAPVHDLDEAEAWIRRQPKPSSGRLEVSLGDRPDDHALRIVFERSATTPTRRDALPGEAARYARAWEKRSNAQVAH